jgi:MFS family permease
LDVSVRRNINLLGWFNFCVDFRLYGPVAILYFTQVTGSFALGMSVFSAAMLSAALLELPTGIFSDRIGRKRTVICGALASTGSLVFYAIGGSHLILLIGAVLEGMARAFFSGNNDALLHDTLAQNGQEHLYQEVLGKISSSYQLALAISAVLGGIIASFSYPLLMWLSVIPQAINVGLASFMVEPRLHSDTETNIYHHLRDSFQNIVRNPRLRMLSLASILSFAVGETAFQFRPTFFALLWPVWAIGLARTVANLGAALSFYFAGRLIRRFGEFRLLLGGISLSEAVNLLSLLIPTVLSPAFMGATSLFFGVNTVSVNGLMQREFNARQRATMGSISSFGGSVTFAIFSYGLGLFADRFGAVNALIIAAVFSFIPVWFYGRAFRSPSAGDNKAEVPAEHVSATKF